MLKDLSIRDQYVSVAVGDSSFLAVPSLLRALCASAIVSVPAENHL